MSKRTTAKTAAVVTEATPEGVASGTSAPSADTPADASRLTEGMSAEATAPPRPADAAQAFTEAPPAATAEAEAPTTTQTPAERARAYRERQRAAKAGGTSTSAKATPGGGKRRTREELEARLAQLEKAQLPGPTPEATAAAERVVNTALVVVGGLLGRYVDPSLTFTAEERAMIAPHGAAPTAQLIADTFGESPWGAFIAVTVAVMTPKVMALMDKPKPKSEGSAEVLPATSNAPSVTAEVHTK